MYRFVAHLLDSNTTNRGDIVTALSTSWFWG
jgi:hypothetical protein